MKNKIFFWGAGIFMSCQSPIISHQPVRNIVDIDTAIQKKHADSAGIPSSINEPIGSEKLITPGKGIGHIILADDPGTVVKLLGKPDFEDAAMGKTLMTWYANHDSTGYQTSIFSGRNMGGKDENRYYIKKIFISSPWFKTNEKLGVGSTMVEIGNSYTLKPVEAYASNKEESRVYIDAEKGISFEINKTNHKCVSIIVLKPHEDVGVYLNMREK